MKSAQVGEGSERCVIIYKEGWSPPEVLEAEVGKLLCVLVCMCVCVCV